MPTTALPTSVPSQPPTATPTLPPGETYPPTEGPTALPTSAPTQAPTYRNRVVCPPDALGVIASDHKTNGGSPVFWAPASAVRYDGTDSSAEVACSHTSGQRYPAGSTTVTCSITGDSSCSFLVSLPLAEYRFNEEPLGTPAANVPIARDRAGSLDLYAANGAAIATDPVLGAPALFLNNVYDSGATPASARQFASSRLADSFANLTTKTMVVLARPLWSASINAGLGQLSGGACRAELRQRFRGYGFTCPACADAGLLSVQSPSGDYDSLISGDETILDPSWQTYPPTYA